MNARAISPSVTTAQVNWTHCARILLSFCLFAACISSAIANASDIAAVANVVGVTDGDTITVLLEKKQRKVRLAQIDAPEAKQPFGHRAKQALSDLTFGKDVTLYISGVDRNGRIVALVDCGGVSVNREMVRVGLAWVYPKFSPKDSPLYETEREAKREKRGLWVDPQPVAPWEWRSRARPNGRPLGNQ